VEVKAFEE
jgi:hypothetical protein